MIFNVSQLLKEPVGSVRSYEIDDHLSMGTDVPECHVKADVNMLRTDKGIWVTATLDSNVPCTCSRCLAGMEFHVIVNVEEEYLPEVDIFTKARLNTPEVFDENFFISPNHVIDMTEAIRQYLDIGTPMNPICSNNCNGLCLTCGVNLNETSCTCGEIPRDPRWGALLDMVSVKEQNVN